MDGLVSTSCSCSYTNTLLMSAVYVMSTVCECLLFTILHIQSEVRDVVSISNNVCDSLSFKYTLYSSFVRLVCSGVFPYSYVRPAARCSAAAVACIN